MIASQPASKPLARVISIRIDGMRWDGQWPTHSSRQTHYSSRLLHTKNLNERRRKLNEVIDLLQTYATACITNILSFETLSVSEWVDDDICTVTAIECWRVINVIAKCKTYHFKSMQSSCHLHSWVTPIFELTISSISKLNLMF